MPQLNDFRNDGFGWYCRHCDVELAKVRAAEHGSSRVFREGEAESKTPQLANQALARWADPARRTLVCPRCGITEPVDVS